MTASAAAGGSAVGAAARSTAGVGRRIRSAPLGPAELRITRTLLLAGGIAGLVYCALGVGDALSETALGGPLDTALYVTVIVLSAALAALALRAPVSLLRGIAVAQTAVFVVSMPVLAAHAAGALDEQTAWQNNVHAVIPAVLAVVVRPAIAWVVACVLPVLAGVLQYTVDVSYGSMSALIDVLWLLVMNVILTSLVLAALLVCRRLDASTANASEALRGQAVAAARMRERLRLDALTHDHVLSLLLVASRGQVGPAELQPLARDTLTALDAVAQPPQPLVDVAPDDLVARLRDVMSAAPQLAFEGRVLSTSGVPAEVALALAEASAEAARNAARHAGGGTRVRAEVVVGKHRVLVRVADRGRGFTPRKISADRLGLRVSIVERMRSVPGGGSRIASRRGVGTTIELSWLRPDRGRA